MRLRFILGAFLLSIFATHVFAARFTWNPKAISHSFTEIANWLNENGSTATSLPTYIDEVIIGTSGGNEIIIQEPVTVGSIQIGTSENSGLQLLAVRAQLTVAGSGVVILQSGALRIEQGGSIAGGGHLRVDGILEVSGSDALVGQGPLTIGSTGQLIHKSPSATRLARAVYATGRVVIEQGSIVFAGASTLAAGSTTTVAYGSLIVVSGILQLRGVINGAGSVIVNRDGNFVLDSERVVSQLDSLFNAAGTVVVQTGTLIFNGLTIFNNTAKFSVEDPNLGRVEFRNNVIFSSSNDISGNGAILISGFGTFAIPPDRTPRITPSVTTTGQINAQSGTVILAGSTHFSESSVVTVAAAAELILGGTAQINSTQNWNVNGMLTVGHDGTAYFSSGSSSGSGTVKNDGELRVSSRSIVQFGSTVNNNARLVVDLHGQMIITGNYLQTTDVAETLLTGGTITTNNGQLNIDQGFLTGFGSVIAQATVVDGTISPGASKVSAGKITFQGDLSLTESGTIKTQIGGSKQGEEFDFVEVKGKAILRGTSDIVRFNEYKPDIGTEFEIMAFSSHEGSFKAAAEGWELEYDSNVLRAKYLGGDRDPESSSDDNINSNHDDSSATGPYCNGALWTVVVGLSAVVVATLL